MTLEVIGGPGDGELIRFRRLPEAAIRTAKGGWMDVAKARDRDVQEGHFYLVAPSGKYLISELLEWTDLAQS